MTNVSKPTFKWTCSYMSSTWFDVTDHTGTYQAELRRSQPTEYELSIANGDDVRRDILGSINLIRREHCGPTDPKHPAPGPYFAMPPATVRAFNEWRLQEHEKHIAMLRAQPERYGTIEAAYAAPPPKVDGGHYIIGTGWIREPVQS